MLRRGSATGLVLAGTGLGLLFAPIAEADGGIRAEQTLTLLVIVGGLAGLGMTSLSLRQRGFVRAASLGLGTLAGALATFALLPSIHDFDGLPIRALAPRLLIVAACVAVGNVLVVAGMRRAFPRANRAAAYAALMLLFATLFPLPMLLMRPDVAALNIVDVRTQLRAGAYYWTVGSVILVAPFLAVLTLPGDWFERWWNDLAAWVVGISRSSFVGALLLGTFALTAFFAWYSFDRRPTTADEIAQLWHARILLSRHLALPPDPNPEFFAIDNIVDRPVWMSQFPIGGPAVLAIGVLFRAAWLLNPVLTALTTWNVYRFCVRAYGEGQARAAALVLALSPLMLLMGGTHMNHTPTACLVTLALAALPVWWSAESDAALRRSAAVIGVSVGAAMAIRPLDGAIATVVFGLVMLAAPRRDARRARSLLIAIAGGAIPVALLLLANWRTTGSPTRFAYEVLWGANHSLGLHDDPTGHPHTAWRALLLGVKYATQLNWIATTWPVPITLIIAAGLICARRANRWDMLLLAFFAAQIFAYSFYWHDGQFIGPRFVFTAVPALLVLAARAPVMAMSRFREGSTGWRIAIAIIPVCLAVAWLRRMPPYGVQGIAREFRESRSRLKLDPPREISSGRVQNALVFVQEGAATRLLHRLWGLGVSRPDAARLLSESDACSLLNAVIAEESAPNDTTGRTQRIVQRATPFHPSRRTVRVPDPNFHVADSASMTPACSREVAIDFRVRNTVAYGGLLLENELGSDGRIAGSAIYVMNLGDRNETLRGRFGDRHWYRYEVPLRGADSLPALVP
ncbi:MAG TPA: hypothetical protein VKH19_16165 [Gemmatimonadaceae bacterium]|nr:hypothetical protein [Gemmatimonadaceae bacterium]